MRHYPDGRGPIAPAEAILAVIGMRAVVTREIEPIDDLTWKRARDLEFEVNKAAHALVEGTLPPPEGASDRPGYFRLLRELAQPYQPEQARAMLEHIPPELFGAAGPFMMLASQAFQLLQSNLPRQFVASVVGGAKPLPPPVRLLDRFDSLFDVLDQPVELLNRAATGQLLRSQVQATEQVYPSLVAYMRVAVARELVHAQADDAMFMLPRATEIGAETLLGVDVTSPALRQLLQNGSRHAQEASSTPLQPVNDVKTPQQFMTRTQRTDANAP